MHVDAYDLVVFWFLLPYANASRVNKGRAEEPYVPGVGVPQLGVRPSVQARPAVNEPVMTGPTSTLEGFRALASGPRWVAAPTVRFGAAGVWKSGLGRDPGRNWGWVLDRYWDRNRNRDRDQDWDCDWDRDRDQPMRHQQQMQELQPQQQRLLAVVTGANKGIGYCIADRLVRAGFRVIAACRNQELGQCAAMQLGAEFQLLDLSSQVSIANFAQQISSKYGRLDVLVNNGAIAFKGSDPTPFAEQTEPTLRTNFYGTVALTDALLPLLRASAASGGHTRIVNVASMSGHLSQLHPNMQRQFESPSLNRTGLYSLVQKFAADVKAGVHRDQGWGNSNYGFSKLAVIAYTKIVAREEGPAMKVNACCPGYCKTDMSSNRGGCSPAIGAETPVFLALLPGDGPTGEFWQDKRISRW